LARVAAAVSAVRSGLSSALIHEPSQLLALSLALVAARLSSEALLAPLLEKPRSAGDRLDFLPVQSSEGLRDRGGAFFVHRLNIMAHFSVGRLFGALALLLLFDWSLIVLSSVLERI